MRALLLAILLGLAAPSSGAQADPAAPKPSASLSWLHGNWSGDATFMERLAKVTLQVGAGPDGSTTTLIYVAEVAATTGRPAFRFEGRGSYRLEQNGKVIGQWSDSAGNLHPLSGRVDGQSMIVNWGQVQTELGFSRYSLGSDGHLSVSDGVYSQGAARIFAQARYRKTG
jgi:hypothetical protein